MRSQPAPGTIKDLEALRSRAYYGGLTPSLRREGWKWLLGCYPPKSTRKDREVCTKGWIPIAIPIPVPFPSLLLSIGMQRATVTVTVDLVTAITACRTLPSCLLCQALLNAKKQEYLAYKKQWESITHEQEARFSKFRDRRHRIVCSI